MTPRCLRFVPFLLLRSVTRTEAGTMPNKHTCPECHQGDVISISMNVSGRDLSFSTCHACEAKWWHRDGEQVVLAEVIDTVVRT
jgi:DNA polymerase III alpha subunit (gram-positive type)